MASFLYQTSEWHFSPFLHTDWGMKATFDNTGVTITKGEKTVTTGVRINKHLYRMKMKLFTQVVYLRHAPRYNCGMSASDT